MFSAIFLVVVILLGTGFIGVRSARAGDAAEIAAVAAGCAALTVADSMLSTQVAVDPHRLVFQSVARGDAPPSQAIAVQCYDYGEYYGDCGGSISVDQPWLKTDRDGFYGVDRVEVAVDTEGLEPGIYEGKIHIDYDFIAIDDSEDVSVELVVDPPEPAEVL